MIGVLVRNKDALSVQDEQGATPLHYTAQLDSEECSKALLKGIPKGKVDVVDREARTALFWAIAKGHFKTAELLLKAGANPNHVDSTGRTSTWRGQRGSERETGSVRRSGESCERWKIGKGHGSFGFVFIWDGCSESRMQLTTCHSPLFRVVCPINLSPSTTFRHLPSSFAHLRPQRNP